jgi:DNA helicase-2/ATP-dependent DNA helicase PcrA
MTSSTARLTEQQRTAGDHPGNMFLLACPGSGKTRTAAARIARLIDQSISVAACSYTNVGVEAVRKALCTDHQATIDTRNFVGTLHGLLLRHVTYPFGHLIHGATPRLLPDDSSLWPVITLNHPGSDGGSLVE